MDEVLRRQSSLERNVMESLMKIQKNLEKRAGGEQFFGVQGKVVKLPSRHVPCLVAPSSHPDLPSIESRRLGGEGRHRPVFDSATPSQMPGGYMHPQVNDVHQGPVYTLCHYVTGWLPREHVVVRQNQGHFWQGCHLKGALVSTCGLCPVRRRGSATGNFQRRDGSIVREIGELAIFRESTVVGGNVFLSACMIAWIVLFCMKSVDSADVYNMGSLNSPRNFEGRLGGQETSNLLCLGCSSSLVSGCMGTCAVK